MYEPNPVKSDRNVVKHRIPFETEEYFDWILALEFCDTRHAYTEVRTTEIGFIGARLHAMVFTRRGVSIRIISLRKANRREVLSYVEFYPAG